MHAIRTCTFCALLFFVVLTVSTTGLAQVATPEDVGMSSERLERINDVVSATWKRVTYPEP